MDDENIFQMKQELHEIIQELWYLSLGVNKTSWKHASTTSYVIYTKLFY